MITINPECLIQYSNCAIRGHDHKGYDAISPGRIHEVLTVHLILILMVVNLIARIAIYTDNDNMPLT